MPKATHPEKRCAPSDRGSRIVPKKLRWKLIDAMAAIRDDRIVLERLDFWSNSFESRRSKNGFVGLVDREREAGIGEETGDPPAESVEE